jgi:adenylylsulfate reductase subunit A
MTVGDTMKIERLKTDILIIGGGTAGCYAALTIAENSGVDVLICEKAHIKRSGCLAAGVNALNAYITEGKTPQFYVDYARKDAAGIVRGDLLLTMSERLNSVTERLEKLGLVILKDENGKYVTRGPRNLKINGENIKPILADAVEKQKNVTVLNRVNITDFAVENNRICGAFGIGIENDTFYIIEADAVIVATGGAAGLYKPNNPGFSRHKMWYPPFNTGAGYAMGINAGAEMTTFEMRFIALRCKDTIAPTGTLAQGVGAKQVNSLGEVYETKYGLTTSERVYGTVAENMAGRGPCCLRTEGITAEQDESLLKAYLNMAPSQTLKWIESGKNPSEQNVEIEGTEPYIVGGHTASGYWVDTNRATTIKGLFAAGDVAGGSPQKYVTGALAEGEIAGLSAAKFVKSCDKSSISEDIINKHIAETEKFLGDDESRFTAEQLEEAMQTVMDSYAGGIKTNYRFNEKQLEIADSKIRQLMQLSDSLRCNDFQELMYIYELRERLTVCLSVIAHLKARQETRWHSFAENTDYPERDDANWSKYVNSRMENGEIKIIFRELVGEGQIYEHSN